MKTKLKTKGKITVKNLSKLKKELDKWFSLYVRHKYAKNGLVACYTCSKVYPIKQMQNGHWIPRNALSTRFDEENCRPQCVGCNMFNNGRPDVFAVNLLQEGINLIKLQQKRHTILKVDWVWYEEHIRFYKEKVLQYDTEL